MTSVTPAVNSPQVLWAQRADSLYLTINLADIAPESLKLDLEEQKLTFAGTSHGTQYAFELNFFDKINVQSSQKSISTRSIFLNIAKLNTEAPWWPRLTSEKTKFNYIKTDFDRWKDEDESDDEPQENPMAGMGGMPGMDDMGEDDSSSDAEDLNEHENEHDHDHDHKPTDAPTETDSAPAPQSSEEQPKE